MSTEYQVEFTRQCEGEGVFTEVGFGSSGASSDLGDCAHAVLAMIQNRQWETEPGMPTPAEVDAEARGKASAA